ncbi:MULTISPECIES: hypothetical protein [Oxalobacteraceae]|uniref:hypothetical protein n=1 Tax=Herminiimonas sp. Marseille-P9896 TaxID=2742211 RepID=UPI0015891894|nr:MULTISPECIES: hypothetical protein [Oxalobacteraceae]
MHTTPGSLRLVAIFTLTFPLLAMAQQKACLMEGSFTVAGEKTEIKDCLQNNGIPHGQFVETCNSLSQATAAFGGPPAKTTYMAACPAQAQGVCVGFFGQPLSSHYYKRDPKTLASTKSGCQAQGGKWQ